MINQRSTFKKERKKKKTICHLKNILQKKKLDIVGLLQLGNSEVTSDHGPKVCL